MSKMMFRYPLLLLVAIVGCGIISGNSNGMIVNAEASRLGESLSMTAGTDEEASSNHRHHPHRRLPHFQHFRDIDLAFNEDDEQCPDSVTSYTAVGKNSTSSVTLQVNIIDSGDRGGRDSCSGIGSLELKGSDSLTEGDRFFFTHTSYSSFCYDEHGSNAPSPIIVIVGTMDSNDGGGNTEVIAVQSSYSGSGSDTSSNRDDEPGLAGVTIYLDVLVEGIHYKYNNNDKDRRLRRKRNLLGIMQSVEPVLTDVTPYQYILDQPIARSMIANTNLKCV